MPAPKVADVAKENLWANNPVTVQILGICSTLAVTNIFLNTLLMGLGLIFVTGFSALTISLMRNVIPPRVRMMVQTLVIACFVVIVDIALKAYVPNISKALGPYVGLIITNCIIMGRLEAFASSNEPKLAFVDGVMAGVGYSWVLLIIAFVRELLGFGTILGYPVLDPLFKGLGFSEGWIQWSFMIMAPGGFFMLGLFIWIGNNIAATKIVHNK
ncbi:NADH:ubiquinone reductase (Na(+)-transporting) subunit D [candidate division KSB3 bacterium]|jgi:Na+-transporting NADH:ubiquinone oxidoreductase subunit D|uniref:NADH:ubiquinone reductase (Na(+)-transporting) subunit D n=1 Tax=candidate division KSB3 bacterium TaxID=2044937 RepID=A0A9D5JZD9_9BACT|nr:NADH:ubiquinone reductase (Na(+)-transporting) subunit D [candidate division KSB3 bacterium]MBD3326602.1 NADH:ubiquinone reductase (Na(+)-transporting) subunit D [candidate division KSB3 bacterium]